MDLALTSDLDWASEYCIEHFLDIVERFSVTPTLFVTHASVAAFKAARDGRAELGIHPNFLPGSSHGEDTISVLRHLLELVPGAKAVRCHRYFEDHRIAAELARHGLELDSNLCRHLESDLHASRLPTGLLRLPVFFEDDVHWSRGLKWRFAEYADAFFAPGLKILNFHPFFVTLNVPDAEFYARHKPHIRTLTAAEAAELRHPGAGAGTFLGEALQAALAGGHRFVTLSQLAAELALPPLMRSTCE
jgi:hypothetical protein